MSSKSVLALAGLLALAWAGTASAQTTNCPSSGFTCAFNAAETLPLSTTTPPPNQAGAPDVYVGYMTFGSGGSVTVVMQQNLNGTTSNRTLTGNCTGGQNGKLGTIDFPSGGPQWMFVTVNSAAGSNGEELDFLQTQNIDNSPTTSTAVRVGVCRSPAP